MSESIIIVGDSRICEGMFERLKAAMAELAELVKAKEPRILAYNVYFSEDGTHLTVFQVHPDSASAELHMEVTGSALRKVAEFMTLSRIDIYGGPSRSLLDKMQRYIALGANIVVHNLHAGFTRF